MRLTIECELEADGRWIAEVTQLPGVMTYGTTRDQAATRAETLALRVLADRLENGESRPVDISISLAAP
ncbi:MAG: type II toxin-antitoxin system HicB family antitoxin [Hyphomicrobium sp.]